MSIDYKAHNQDRLRRARSWLEEAGKPDRSDEAAFLFYWIAFNAAYGQIADETTRERRVFMAFTAHIIELDSNDTIKNAITEHSLVIKSLIENQYVYEPFWRYVRGEETGYWEKEFALKNKYVWKKWGRGAVSDMLAEILSRLYTLRNQIMHGGVTYGQEGWGKKQLKSGRNMMSLLVPPIIDIMATTITAQPDTDIWGAVSYPRDKQRDSAG